jgi:hypothetical protein
MYFRKYARTCVRKVTQHDFQRLIIPARLHIYHDQHQRQFHHIIGNMGLKNLPFSTSSIVRSFVTSKMSRTTSEHIFVCLLITSPALFFYSSINVEQRICCRSWYAGFCYRNICCCMSLCSKNVKATFRTPVALFITV